MRTCAFDGLAGRVNCPRAFRRSALRACLIALPLALLAASAHAEVGALDRYYRPNVNERIFALAIDDQDRAIIGGFFFEVGGQPQRTFARINTDGSLDSTFATSFAPGSQGRAVAIQDDGKVLVGGQLGGSGILRLLDNGSIDPGFNATTNDAAYTIWIQDDNRIVIAGGFSLVNGSQISWVARLNPNGSVDPTFPLTADNFILDAARQSDGKWLIVGDFTTLNGMPHERIARLNADGSLDPDFNPPIPDTTVQAVAQDANGKIMLGGAFTHVGEEFRNHIARLLEDGSLDDSFALSVDGAVYDLTPVADGNLVVAGSFNNVGAYARADLARLDAQGQVDVRFKPSVSSGLVIRAARQSDDKLVFGGIFQAVDGRSRPNMARLDADNDRIFADGFEP